MKAAHGLGLALVLILAATACLPGEAAAGETITVEGTTHRNAELVEAAPGGAVYRTEEGEHVVLPWPALTPAQLSALAGKFPDAIENAICGVWHVRGTVFDVLDDGIVIQVTLPDGE